MNGFEAIINNFWLIFIIFTLLWPRFRQQSLNRARKRELTTLGSKRGSNVITLIHRQETLSLFGIPITRYIDIDDSEEVLRAIRLTPDDTPIDLIIHTPGGIALAATQIAFALDAHPAKKTVMVPHYAMSGGTLIAMAADEIMMDPHAVLGPVDPQLGDATGAYSATSILKVVEKKKIDEMDDKTLILAEESRKAVDQIKGVVRALVSNISTLENTEKIVEELVSGKYTHDFPITAEEACELFGECVNRELPREVYSLMNLYKMETRPRRPSVEFVPSTPAKGSL
ncbi:MAG: ATP-dependent Clp protease proteolytic subunit [Candidatus Bathyarchaeota archaeon]|nr:MAG: ATP-dependent Clp protease proteolytic subunit [Candidatus Bathyarchaeota archaeon]